MSQLTSVHDAIQRAQDEQEESNLEVVSFRANPELFKTAQKICHRNSVTMSAFLRGCINGLIDDYEPPKK